MFFLLLFATFASVSLSAEPSGDPMAGTPYGEKLKVTYERVAMRDGVELAVRIIRPDVEGRVSGRHDLLPLPFPEARRPGVRRRAVAV